MHAGSAHHHQHACHGAVQHGRWEKASPEHPLLVYDKTGAQMLFNRGKTYLAIVDDDEWSNFSYQ